MTLYKRGYRADPRSLNYLIGTGKLSVYFSEGFPTLIQLVFLDERQPEESCTIRCVVFLCKLSVLGVVRSMRDEAVDHRDLLRRLTHFLACCDSSKDEG